MEGSIPPQIVSKLILSSKAICITNQGHIRERADAARGKECEVVISVAPAVSDFCASIDNEECQALLLQGIRRGEPGLPRPDNQDVGPHCMPLKQHRLYPSTAGDVTITLGSGLASRPICEKLKRKTATTKIVSTANTIQLLRRIFLIRSSGWAIIQSPVALAAVTPSPDLAFFFWNGSANAASGLLTGYFVPEMRAASRSGPSFLRSARKLGCIPPST